MINNQSTPGATESERRFVARATEAGTIVHAVRSHADFVSLISGIGNGAIPILSPAFVESWPDLVVSLGSDVEVATSDPWRHADAPLGIVAGSYGVCETGSVLVDESRMADRVVSMFTKCTVQVVPRQLLFDSLDAAASLIAEAARRGSFLSLITGPSRTADIERSMTIGVQGPSDLHVVLV